MKLSLVTLTTVFGFSNLIGGLALIAPVAANLVQPPKSQDPAQPDKILKAPKDNTAATAKKLADAAKPNKPKVKYSVVKACNQGEFLFLKESTKKSGFLYWQVRLSDGKVKVKDVLVATDARFSLVQNQTQSLAPVVLSEIRSYSTKDLMEMEAKNLVCK